MSSSRLVQGAAAELYAVPPGEFIARRAELAGQARSAGENAAAKQIGALRKPTQSAWVVNQLVRAVPDAAERLGELGRRMRKAQRTLDGAAIRDLSAERRALVDELTRQAFRAAALAGPAPPAAALRDEVATTLAAAVADPDIADQVAGGATARAARSDGFGAGAPVLTLVRPAGAAPEKQPAPGTPAAKSPAAKGPAATSPGPQSPAVRSPAAKRPAAKAGAAAKTGTAAKERARARAAEAKAAERERQQRHREALAQAQKAVTQADKEAEAAAKAQEKLQAAVTRLEDELDEARSQLARARSQSRQARVRARQAGQSLDRMRR